MYTISGTALYVILVKPFFLQTYSNFYVVKGNKEVSQGSCEYSPKTTFFYMCHTNDNNTKTSSKTCKVYKDRHLTSQLGFFAILIYLNPHRTVSSTYNIAFYNRNTWTYTQDSLTTDLNSKVS